MLACVAWLLCSRALLRPWLATVGLGNSKQAMVDAVPDAPFGQLRQCVRQPLLSGHAHAKCQLAIFQPCVPRILVEAMAS